VLAEVFGLALGFGLEAVGVFLPVVLGDLDGDTLLAVEVAGDFALFLGDDLLAVDAAGYFEVLIDEGRGLAEEMLGLTGAAPLGLDVAGLGAGRAFWAAAGVQVLGFVGALGPVMALLPPVVESLKPKGLVADCARGPGALLQFLMALP
jgi:hypothetical protein